jgi:hypothetical protein
MPQKDVEGAKDNPLLSRYAGSVIVSYSKKAFDDTDLVAGRYKKSGPNTPPFEKIIYVEGAVTRIAYLFPADLSALEVMRNYSDALRKANMSIVFSCDRSACGADDDDNFSQRFLAAKITAKLGIALLFGALSTLAHGPIHAWWFAPWCIAGWIFLIQPHQPLGNMAVGLAFGMGWFTAGK